MNPLPEIRTVQGRTVVVPGNDIDTDRIIPARFLKCVTFDALGPQLFHDERYHEDGSEKAHPLNEPRAEGATILVSGRNFGSGSSREHAPQSIHKAGFRAVIAVSFAEIFFGNATTLGVPCMALDDHDMAALRERLARDPEAVVTADVEAREVRVGDQAWRAELPDGARSALMSGRWDPLADLLEGADDVQVVAERLGYLPGSGANS